MELYLSEEQENILKKNENLVHYIANKISKCYNDYDDIFQDGMIGLMKAVSSYNSDKNTKFATYASRCITNEIFMGFRKNKKHSDNISLETELSIDENGDTFVIGDTISDMSVMDFGEKMINDEGICEYVNVIINCLSNLEKMTMLYQMADIPQHYVAMILNICQSYVSRIISKSQNKIEKIIGRKKVYEKKFKIQLVNYEFKMEILLKYLGETIQEFEIFLTDVKKSLNLSGFKLTLKDERLIIYFFAMEESFLYIAQVINRIENRESVNVNYVSEVINKYRQSRRNVVSSKNNSYKENDDRNKRNS